MPKLSLSGLFRSITKPSEVKGYRGIKRTGPAVLDLARRIVHDHLMDYVDEGQIDEVDINDHVNECIAKLATWPESMTITYLLRDLDPEDFYHA
jgi:hypothetical protein